MMISPETVAQHLEDAGVYPWETDAETAHALQKLCADRGDREGLAFWVSVYTQFLINDSYFAQTRCLPDIENDDPIEYLAMVFWDDGWQEIDPALWCAQAHQHPVAIRFFNRLLARSEEVIGAQKP